MKNLFTFLLFLSPFSTIAQGWETVFSYPEEVLTLGLEVHPTSDGGFVIAGELDFPTGAIRHGIRFAKTDSLGIILWEHNYKAGEINDESVVLLDELPDGDFILGGSQSSIPYIFKTDSEGEVIWEKTFDADTSRHITSGVKTTDDNFMLSGITTPNFPDLLSFYIMKSDTDGNLLWEKYHTFSDHIHEAYIGATNDGGAIVVGVIGNELNLFKLDPNGNIEWQNPYNFSNSEEGYVVKQTPDGGYIIGGRTIGIGDIFPLIFKTDSLGNGEWIKNLTIENIDIVSDIIIRDDGGYTIVGDILHIWSFADNGYIMELDDEGEMVWYENFNSAEQKIASIKPTFDGDYILAGQASEGMLLKKIGGTITSQKEIPNVSSIDVFPNPMETQTTFEIKTSNTKNINLQVFDVMGKMVREETHVNSTFSFYKKNLSNGIYFYKIKNGNVLLGNGKLVID